MVQAVTSQGQASPVTQIAIGRAAKNEPVKMVFQLPINIWIPAGLTMVYDGKETGVPATFRSCVPAGCFADLDLKDDMLKKLRSRTLPGRFEFKDAAQRNVVIPISFKGFGLAFDALSKE
jgi:invasion protein IalB